MRWLLLLLLAAFPILACEISPVVSGVPDDGRTSGSARYDDCRRVSRDYCKDVVAAADQELRSCVAEATYRCVSGQQPDKK